MIKKYFNLFENAEIDEIWKYLNSPNWEFWHKSNTNDTNYFWHMNLEDHSFFTKDLFSKIKNHIGKNFSIDRVYANGQTFGLDGSFHTDSLDPNAYTFLYYPMRQWNVDWNGETIIIDPNDSVNYCIPIPNSAVCFPANWIHYGRSPSKKFVDLRVTIAYKLTKHD